MCGSCQTASSDPANKSETKSKSKFADVLNLGL